MLKAILVTFALAAAALGQSQVNMDLQEKGSRPPYFGVDSGSANTYRITTTGPLGPSLRTGSVFMFFAAHGNTGASTLAIDGGSAIALDYNVSTALPSGCISTNQEVFAQYDGTRFQLIFPNCGGGGSGTVTSVGLSMDSTFTVTGSPVTTSGTLTETPNVAGADYLITSTASNADAWKQVNGGSNCGDGSHAVSYSTSSHTFGCQTLTGGGGGSLDSPYTTPIDASSTIPYTGMWLWLSADCFLLSGSACSSGPANGTGIDVWQDRSGNWLLLSASTSHCVYDTNQINSLPAIAVDGSCDMTIYGSGSFTWSAWKGDVTMFAVVKSTSTSAQAMVSGNNYFEWRLNQISGSLVQQTNYQNHANIANGTTAISGWTQINMQCAPSTLIASSVNPTFRTARSTDTTAGGASSCFTVPSGTTGLTSIAWGGSNVGEGFHGFIAEIIVYGRYLSSAEVTSVESYLFSKYGI